MQSQQASRWEEKVDEFGRTFYIDHINKITSWEPPSNISTQTPQVQVELPPGWERKVDESGRTFYIDHINKASSWEDPRVSTNPIAVQATVPTYSQQQIDQNQIIMQQQNQLQQQQKQIDEVQKAIEKQEQEKYPETWCGWVWFYIKKIVLGAWEVCKFLLEVVVGLLSSG